MNTGDAPNSINSTSGEANHQGQGWDQEHGDEDAFCGLEKPQEAFDSGETQAKYDQEGLEEQRYENGKFARVYTTLTILTTYCFFLFILL
jgi:hypothetical protein